ncbi:uncharacterized protein [Garra rufa]|uniref:uncharacterized protein n=1 Tax=Garra rufa TaxID=137080 RepID=UPI003CCEC451
MDTIKMALVDEDSEDFWIQETVKIKQEDTEEQTDMTPLKEDNQEINAAEENSTKTGNTSLENGAQERLQPYICGQCGKSFRSKKHIYQHMRVHSKKIICRNGRCKMIFPDWKQLKEHVKIHIRKRKPFMCLDCGKNFINQRHLTIHMRVHTGEKPFACEVCGKKFIQKSSVTVHMRTHTGEKPFVCLHCGKGFTISASLKDHVRIHTGEKPFSCKLCEKKYSTKQYLKIHMRTHTGERPYKCLWCEETYVYPRDLKNHLRTHSRKRSSVPLVGMIKTEKK